MFRANERHTGVYNDGGIRPNNIERWRFKTGDTVISAPAVVNGVVYVGSGDYKVYALDANTVQNAGSSRLETGLALHPPSPTASSTSGALTTTSTL
ncbi:MAG: PQQ-binding-like beta-propeller repeat protein [Euryarchaeota archaeon]